MDKDESILALLRLLDLGSRGWETVDNWDSASFAIGIARIGEPDRLAYVSTHEMPEGRYFFECDVRRQPDSPVSHTINRGEDVGLDGLIEALEKHLGRKE